MAEVQGNTTKAVLKGLKMRSESVLFSLQKRKLSGDGIELLKKRWLPAICCLP